jgi:hypothetical protein
MPFRGDIPASSCRDHSFGALRYKFNIGMTVYGYVIDNLNGYLFMISSREVNVRFGVKVPDLDIVEHRAEGLIMIRKTSYLYKFTWRKDRIKWEVG